MATGKASRRDGRRANELRPVKITPGYVATADGSCLIEQGNTRVICTASLVQGVRDWLAGSGQGWLTAEYAMLPASTGKRKSRPTDRPDSRATEIQRFIGRTLRSVVRLEKLGENTIYLDCDVLTADGGTRTAAITGAYVALAAAMRKYERIGLFGRPEASAPRASGRRPGRALALKGPVAAVSVGIMDGEALLDLDYAEDAAAEVDVNVALTKAGRFVEIQGSAEGRTFDAHQLQKMLRLARGGIRRLIAEQERALRKIR